MRCFRVLIHGQFERFVQLGTEDTRARGFYTTRWIVADAKDNAISKAFESAKAELQQWSDIRDGLVAIQMEADDVSAGSWWRWLRGGGRGFAFYTDD